MRTSSLPPIRYLSAGAVSSLMPSIEESLSLAAKAMEALATEGAAELPSKIAIHPRPTGSFAHAMPAHLRGSEARGAEDLIGMKWIAGFPTNNALGVHALSALVVLNDPRTGAPIAVLDGGPITAARTAAVSGLAIRLFAPAMRERAIRAAIIGAGVQGRSHLPVLGHLLPGVEVAIFDRHPERAAALAELARGIAGIRTARVASTARTAVEGTEIVVTAASFRPVRQVMTNAWVSAAGLVIPVDYATYCAAEVARDAALFAVDDRAQFLAHRDAGLFDGYPDPSATLGELLLARRPRPRGRVVITHLGVGLADIVFADAILKAAEQLDAGVLLPRS
jgi:ornithine cyclodeaminase/alanine dehydrogenase